MNKARLMIGLVFLLLFSGVGANVYLVYAASGDPSFAVEPGYYEKAVRWDETQAARRESAELGWRTVVRMEQGRVVVALRDREGRSIQDANVELEVFHNARSRTRTKGRASPSDGAYALDGDFSRRGRWITRLSATRGEAQFVDEVEVLVP